MAVYHHTKGARPPNLADFVDPGLLPKTCRVAAVVADTLDPENGLVTNGRGRRRRWFRGAKPPNRVSAPGDPDETDRVIRAVAIGDLSEWTPAIGLPNVAAEASPAGRPPHSGPRWGT